MIETLNRYFSIGRFCGIIYNRVNYVQRYTYMKCEFDIKMSTSALYDYNMHHAYTGASGLLGTMVGILLILGFLGNTSYYAMLVAGIIIILYMPITLYTRAKKQMLLNPAFKKPIHYLMDDTGVTVSDEENSMTVEWKDMYKAYSTNQSIILATSRYNAWIFPKKDLGEDRYSLIEMISTHMPPDKVKIKQ